jgi:hypothetical protein
MMDKQTLDAVAQDLADWFEARKIPAPEGCVVMAHLIGLLFGGNKTLPLQEAIEQFSDVVEKTALKKIAERQGRSQ